MLPNTKQVEGLLTGGLLSTGQALGALPLWPPLDSMCRNEDLVLSHCQAAHGTFLPPVVFRSYGWQHRCL